MIKTAEEYEQAVKVIDRTRLEAYINTIPYNINRSGKHFQKLIKNFKNQQHEKSIARHT